MNWRERKEKLSITVESQSILERADNTDFDSKS